MDPLFQALRQKPTEARMHAPLIVKSGLFPSLVRGISYLSDDALAKKVSKEILPSLGLTKREVAKLQQAAVRQLEQIRDAEQSKFPVGGSCTLDRIAFSASKKPMSDRKFIVYFLPNYELWQSKVDFFAELRTNLGVDVICSNYRSCGTGKSKEFPLNEQVLIDDGVAQVQQLIDQGAKPENIALFGYSLGGGVSLAVAGLLQDNNVTVNVVNERSFRSLSAVILGTDITFKEIGASAIKSLGWNLTSEEYLEKLKGKIVLIHNDADDVIGYEPSLKGALDSKPFSNKKQITCIAMQKTRTKDQHNRVWTVQEKKAIFAAIRSSFEPR